MGGVALVLEWPLRWLWLSSWGGPCAEAKQALLALKMPDVLPVLLLHGQVEVRCFGFDLLELLGGAEVSKEVASCSSHENELVRQRAILACPLLPDAIAIEVLSKFLQDPAYATASMSSLAMSSMASMGRRAQPLASLVTKQLMSPEASVRLAAARALAQLGPANVLKAMGAAMRAEELEEVRLELVKAIGAQGWLGL